MVVKTITITFKYMCDISTFFVQVSTWFANARRRMKKASQEEDENSTGDESSGSEQTESSGVAPS